MSKITRTQVIEKIGLILLKEVKHSAHIYYVTIDPKVIAAYELTTGDLLKLNLIEVRKDRERVESENKSN